MKILKEDYTHHASWYGIPCLWNEETEDLCGANRFYDALLDILSYWLQFYSNFLSCFQKDVDDSFCITVKEKIDHCCK